MYFIANGINTKKALGKISIPFRKTTGNMTRKESKKIKFNVRRKDIRIFQILSLETWNKLFIIPLIEIIGKIKLTVTGKQSMSRKKPVPEAFKIWNKLKQKSDFNAHSLILSKNLSKDVNAQRNAK